MYTVESQTTFASLCLVSKRFLPIARSNLYYRPVPTMEATWTRAIALHASLVTPLARFVHSLEGIVEFVGGIEYDTEPNFPLSFGLRGYTKLFSLHYSFVSACPRLVAIDLNCDTVQAPNAIFKALEHSLPTLKTVNLVGGSIWRFDDQIAEEALRRSQLQQIKHLVIDNINIDFTSQLNGSVPILRSLSIVAEVHFNHVRRLFPGDRSTLRTSRLDVSTIGADRFTDLLSSLCPSFETLEIICRDNKLDDPPYLRSYEQKSFTSYSLDSVAGFESLSSLTNLALKRFQGPSLPFLNVLCTAAPHLNTIDFTSCLWISTPDSSNPASDPESDHPTRIFAELAVLANLHKLPHLRCVRLGYLPTIDANAYPVLAQSMKTRNVELEWVPCRPDPVE